MHEGLIFKPAFSYRDVALPKVTDGCKWPSDVEGGRKYITETSVDGQKEAMLQLGGGFGWGLKTTYPKQIFYEPQRTASERSFTKKDNKNLCSYTCKVEDVIA